MLIGSAAQSSRCLISVEHNTNFMHPSGCHQTTNGRACIGAAVRRLVAPTGVAMPQLFFLHVVKVFAVGFG